MNDEGDSIYKYLCLIASGLFLTLLILLVNQVKLINKGKRLHKS